MTHLPLRAVAASVATVVMVTVLAGCGFERRKHDAQVLLDASKKLEATSTGHGALTMAVKAEKVTGGFNSAVVGVRDFSTAPAALQLDFAHRRAAVKPTGATQVAAAGQQVFVGNLVFVEHPGNATAGDSVDSQFGDHSWTKLDFSKIGKKDTNTLGQAAAINPINPAYLIRLLAGTLTGSVRVVGREQLNGTATTHFTMNVDRIKAFSRLDDKDRQAVDKAFKSFNVKGDVYKHAEAWIDDTGLPRRIVVRVHQQLDTDTVFGLSYTIDLTGYGTPVDIQPPSADATADVTTLNALLNSAAS